MAISNNIAVFLKQKARIERMPITVNFELLPVCNLNCKMCYIRSSWNDVKNNGGLKTADEWLKIAKQLKEAGSLFLLLTGGEVFLYPEFKRLYIELYKMGFVLTINTNATLIDEKVVEWLKQYPPKCVSISLYGSSNETYEELCGAKGMFNKVKHAIELLQKNNIVIECKTMLNSINYKDLEECYKFTCKHNVIYEAAVYSYPAIRKVCKEKQLRFTPKEVAEYTFYRNRIMSSKEGYQKEIVKFLKKYEMTKNDTGKINYGFNCTAGNTSCWITWQGKMLPCAMMVEPYTNPFEIGFLEAWNELKNKIDKIMLSPKCSHCDKRAVCIVCPASSYAETGSFDGTSQYHCDLTDELFKEMYKYIKENNINLDDFNINGERK